MNLLNKSYLSIMENSLFKKPRLVGCEINNICNAQCSFCGYGNPKADGRKKNMLDIEVFRHTLKLYSEAGGGNFALSPILGEVSMDNRWLELVKEIRHYSNITGISCYTNAIRLHKFGSKEILTSGLSNIKISTSLTSEESYRRIYGVNRYKQVVQNVLDLLKTNQALGYPADINIALRIDKPYSQFYDSPLYAEIIKYTKPGKISILTDGWEDFNGLIAEKDLPYGQKFKLNEPDEFVPCYGLFRKLQVMIDGTIQACSCRVAPHLWVGNIKDYNTLEDAWRNEHLENLRKNWFEGHLPEGCKKCTHYAPYTNLLKQVSMRKKVRQTLGKIKRKILSLPVVKKPLQLLMQQKNTIPT